MASNIKTDAAAQQAAAEARRRAQEEAAARAAAAAKAAAAAAAAAKAQTASKKGFGPDELSTGAGGALRRAATNQLASTGLPTAAAPLASPSLPAFKVNAFGGGLQADRSYDQIEALRAQRAGLASGTTVPATTVATTTPATTVAATTPRTLNPASVAQANQDYDAYKNFGAGTTAAMVQLIKQHQNDPDYCAQLIGRAKDPNDGVLDYITGPLNGAFMKDSGGAYAGFDESDRQAIAGAVKNALDAGTITEQEIRDRAANSPGMADVAQRIGIGQSGQTQSSADATAQLSQAKGDYDSAHADVLEKEKRLAQELAAMGPAMTDTQRAKYIQAFRSAPENADAYKKEADAAKNLADTLAANKSAMLDAATRDPAARQQLYDSLKALADSGQGKTALDFAVAIQKDPSSPLGAAFASQFPKFDDEITAKAMSSAASQLMVEGADPKSALEQIKQMVEPLKTAWEMKGSAGDVADAWKAIGEAADGKYDGLKKLAEEWDGKSGPMKALAGLGVLFGAVSAGKAASQGDYLEAVKGFATAGQEGLDLLAGATKSLADAGKLAQYGEDGLKFASFAERLAPGLGLVANAASAVIDWKAANQNGFNVGYAAAAFGDAVGVLGSAIELFPPAAPIGALINGIGGIISGAGSILGGILDGNKFKDDQKKYLTAAGVTQPLLDALLNSDQDQVKGLLNLGFSPEQIQQLASQYPQLLQTSHGEGPDLAVLQDLQKRFGLSSAQVFNLINSTGSGAGMSELMWVLGNPNFFPGVANAQSVSELISQLQAQASQTNNSDQAAALQKAIAYLQSQQPAPYNGPH